MSLLAALTLGNNVEVVKESIGGGGPMDSGVYDFKVEMAYLEKSKGGALGVHMIFKNSSGATLRNTQYITSGDAKGNKPTYTKDGKEFPLPGYSIVNAICVLSTGKNVAQIADGAEEKVIKVYDFDVRAEVPKPKNVLVDLLGQEISLAVFKEIVDKNVKDASGKYVPSGETREQNDLAMVFNTDSGLTLTESLAKAEKPELRDKWINKWEGEVHNKASKTAKPATGGMPQAAPGAATTAPLSFG